MKNKKGFTLIELLAVIVILGLLMAIAIPSVTKYITESRKKTLASTIGNYMSSVVNDINDLNYTFTGYNTVYAVPIECISLERGGTNPFGAWYQSNDAYWGYVLVQYDDEISKYVYGFTFKDSAGYGLYPTSQAKLNEQGKQIKTGLDLTKPTSGNVIALTSLNNWSGFKIDESTRLIVLEATSEGEVGDGENTCTLSQKGDNYDVVEKEKKEKYKFGKEVCLDETECFYIIDSNVNTVTMLAKSRLNINETIPKQTPTSSGSIKFANNYYWLDGSNLSSKYGNSYPAYVYDENSIIYSYVEKYEEYLRNDLGKSSVTASLISYEQLVNKLGCKNGNCSHLNWINMGYQWWSGSAYGSSSVSVVTSTGLFTNYPPTNLVSIRPIIVINKSQINI